MDSDDGGEKVFSFFKKRVSEASLVVSLVGSRPTSFIPFYYRSIISLEAVAIQFLFN